MHPLLLAFCLHVAPALPAPLVEAIRAGEKKSHPLAISRASAQAGGAQAQSAFAALLPSLSANGTYVRNQNESVVEFQTSPGSPSQKVVLQPFNQLFATVTLNVPLVDPAGYERYAQARHARDAAEASVDSSRRDVQLSIAQVYYRVVAAQGVLEAAERAVATAQKDEQDTELRVTQGVTDKLALEKAKVDTAAAESNRVLAAQNLALARRQFATLTGLPEPQALPEPGPPETLAEREDGLVNEAISTRDDLRALQAQVDAADSGKSAAWAGALPVLAANAEEHFTNASGFVGQSSYWTAGATLNWLVDPVLTSANLKLADAQRSTANEQLAQAKEQVRDQVHAAVLAVDTDRARLEQAKLAVDSAHEALRLARLKLQQGVATSLEVSQAQSDAFNAEASLAQARAELAFALLSVRRAAGELLVQD